MPGARNGRGGSGGGSKRVRRNENSGNKRITNPIIEKGHRNSSEESKDDDSYDSSVLNGSYDRDGDGGESGVASSGDTSSFDSNRDRLEGTNVFVPVLPKSVRTKSCQGVAVGLFAKTLFAKKKFVLSDSELEFSETNKSSICYQCLVALNMDVDKKNKGFWEEYKHVIPTELSNKRSNVEYAMRKEWMSKYFVGVS
jgi:hypothetical protein